MSAGASPASGGLVHVGKRRLRRAARAARAAPCGSARWRRGRVVEVDPSLCFDGAFTAMISSRVYAAPAGDRRLRVRVGRRNAAGGLAAERFPRLRDMLASTPAKWRTRSAACATSAGRPALRFKVRGTLPLRCQRCLEPMAFEVDTDETLVLAATLAEIHAEPADAHAPDRRGRGQGDGAARAGRGRADPRAAVRAAARELRRRRRAATGTRAESPFAGLRGLMHGKH